jgi:hypothetical protein
MRPKEKANELLDNYWLMDKINPSLSKEQAKKCALVAVDEIIFVLEFNLDFKMEKSIKYWQEVKKEIQNL